MRPVGDSVGRVAVLGKVDLAVGKPPGQHKGGAARRARGDGEPRANSSVDCSPRPAGRRADGCEGAVRQEVAPEGMEVRPAGSHAGAGVEGGGQHLAPARMIRGQAHVGHLDAAQVAGAEGPVQVAAVGRMTDALDLRVAVPANGVLLAHEKRHIGRRIRPVLQAKAEHDCRQAGVLGVQRHEGRERFEDDGDGQGVVLVVHLGHRVLADESDAGHAGQGRKQLPRGRRHHVVGNAGRGLEFVVVVGGGHEDAGHRLPVARTDADGKEGERDVGVVADVVEDLPLTQAAVAANGYRAAADAAQRHGQRAQVFAFVDQAGCAAHGGFPP